jgi:protein-S-isoprenylcysteine O-methyltransferase Ste14
MKLSVVPLVLGLILASYWGRVLRMAYKARQKTGRAANLVPPEPLGRALRIIWAPAIAVWIAQPFVTALAARSPWPWRPLYYNPWLAGIGAIVVAVCFVATRACWKKMGRAWRMGIDLHENTPLIATGPFAYVRHPIYALSQAMMLASLAAIPSPLMFAAAVVHITLLQWESRREERHLLRVQGEQYEKYCRNVGRFLPKHLRAYIGAESPMRH